MLRLTIQHNIHLLKDERYDLHNGKEICVVGVSLPIWTINGLTSEPGREVFCNYYLKNPKKEVPIKFLVDGYELTIPYREGKKLEISDEEYRFLISNNDQKKLDELKAQTIREVSSKNLLDIKDGGSQFLNYRELNTVSLKNRTIEVMHHVTLSTIEKLEKSFIS